MPIGRRLQLVAEHSNGTADRLVDRITRSMTVSRSFYAGLNYGKCVAAETKTATKSVFLTQKPATAAPPALIISSPDWWP